MPDYSIGCREKKILEQDFELFLTQSFAVAIACVYEANGSGYSSNPILKDWMGWIRNGCRFKSVSRFI